ncbi:MAG: hypothetical protein NC218_02890 [Acetobacter sp.]|nr:hypothetical protein [Acetobacter sp.]
MAENDTSLDAFITTPAAEKQQENTADTINLEDEFAKLLNDFISQDTKPAETTSAAVSTEANSNGLDSFITPTTNNTMTEGLESFVTQTEPNSSVSSAENELDELVTTSITTNLVPTIETDKGLKSEEQELARAIANFQDGIYSITDKKNLKVPETDYTEELLKPNYKPSVGKKIAQYMLNCWDILNKADPENMKRLSKNATDEEYLAFAETLSDTDMQLAIISYVEILINLEICEVKYEQKKEILLKNRIKKELYEEYMELQERKALFIQKLKEKDFPIDAERLISNYFRVAQKDPDGSFDALTKNPAMFSPIEFDKLHPKFFGLIKVTPEDGIKANQKIGKFIKNLKV